MRLFGRLDGTIDRYDRADWLTPPFDLAFSTRFVTPSVIRREQTADGTPLRRAPASSGTIRRPASPSSVAVRRAAD
jgi:hypothetical protein